MNNLLTVIKFAAIVGKAPQQIYGSLRNGSFPSEYVEKVATASGGVQPMIKQEAVEWFRNKEIARLSKVVQIPQQTVYTVDQLLIDLTKADKKGLVTQLQKFIAAKN